MGNPTIWVMLCCYFYGRMTFPKSMLTNVMLTIVGYVPHYISIDKISPQKIIIFYLLWVYTPTLVYDPTSDQGTCRNQESPSFEENVMACCELGSASKQLAWPSISVFFWSWTKSFCRQTSEKRDSTEDEFQDERQLIVVSLENHAIGSPGKNFKGMLHRSSFTALLCEKEMNYFTQQYPLVN